MLFYNSTLSIPFVGLLTYYFNELEYTLNYPLFNDTGFKVPPRFIFRLYSLLLTIIIGVLQHVHLIGGIPQLCDLLLHIS